MIHCRCDAGYAYKFVRFDVLDSFCWMYAHFDIHAKYEGPCAATRNTDKTPLYNTYYQWVPLYLSTLAVLFYLPRVLWSKLEGGVQKYFSQDKLSRVEHINPS